jgi:hypothetical protein
MVSSAAMGALIESLPTITEGEKGNLRAIYNKDEQNLITDDQIAAAYAKGWTPMYFDSYWKPYDNRDTAIKSLTLAPSNGAWYDLSGRRLATRPTSKGIYIYNGKKMIIK